MPLRRAENGGWERVSAEQLARDEERVGITDNSINSQSSWALEGARRIRQDQVDQKMKYLTGMAAIGGFLFGYDTGRFRQRRSDELLVFSVLSKILFNIFAFLFETILGVISGAMPLMKRAFSLTPLQQEVVVSCTVLSAFLSSIVGGNLNVTWGRRKCILFAAAVFTIGSILLMCAWDYYTLVFGRIIVGIAIGIASLTTPVYIAGTYWRALIAIKRSSDDHIEVAVPSMRGRLVTINGFLV